MLKFLSSSVHSTSWTSFHSISKFPLLKSKPLGLIADIVWLFQLSIPIVISIQTDWVTFSFGKHFIDTQCYPTRFTFISILVWLWYSPLQSTCNIGGRRVGLMGLIPHKLFAVIGDCSSTMAPLSCSAQQPLLCHHVQHPCALTPQRPFRREMQGPDGAQPPK